MRRLCFLPLLLVLVLALAVPVLAQGTYRLDIVVSDNTSSDRTGVPTLVLFNVSQSVDFGYLSANGTDSRMFEGTSECEYMVASDRLGILSLELLADQERSYRFETSYSPPNDFGVIVGRDGCVTVADNTTIELGDNFTVEQSGWVNTDNGSDKNLVYKEDAFRIAVSPTIPSNIDVRMYSAPSDVLQYSNDSENSSAEQDTWVLLKEIIVAEEIEGARIKIDIKASSGGASVYGKAYQNDVAIGSSLLSPADGSWATRSEDNIFSAVSGDRLQIYGYPRAALTCYIKNFRIYFDSGASVTATGVASGEHTIKVEAVTTPDATVVSDTLQYSNDSENTSSTQDTWVLLKEIEVDEDIDGARLKFDIRASGVGVSVKGRVYKNNVAIGTEQHATADAQWSTFSEDLGLSAVATDEIQVWGMARGTRDVRIKNFRIYFDRPSLKVYVDDIEEDSVDLFGASVLNNSENWTFLQNNVMPYTDNVTISVDGARKLWYRPNYIIESTRGEGTADAGSATELEDAILDQGDDYWNEARLVIIATTDGLAPEGENSVVTDFDDASDTLTFGALTAVVGAGDNYTVTFATLIDRESSNDGRITWGVNEGLVVAVGGLASLTTYTSSPTEESDPPTVLPLPGGITMWEDPSDVSIDWLPPSLVQPAADLLEWNINTLYGVLLLFAAMGVGVGAAIATGSALLAAIAVAVGLVVAASTGAVGWWVVLVFSIFGASYLVAARSM